MESSLNGKTIFLSGGSRGIGLAIAMRAARDGANIAIAAKTAEPHASLPGTIYSAAQEIEKAGGQALPLLCDIREEGQVEAAIAATIETFGSLDICINNASAVRLTPILETPIQRFDLMHEVNSRGTFLVSQKAIPHLLNAPNPHLFSIAPPLLMEERWFAPHAAYTMAKYGMSMLMLGLSGEFRGRLDINCLWPRTGIDTAAMNEFSGKIDTSRLRSPAIMADAAYLLMLSDAKATNGNFFVDDEFLASHGIDDLSHYGPEGVADIDLTPDLFIASLRQLRGLPEPENAYRFSR